MKKIISLVLASVLVLSLLAACGNQKGEESPKADATVKQPQFNDPGSNITEPSETKPEEQGVTAQRISKITWTMRDDDYAYSLIDEYDYENNGIVSWLRHVEGELWWDYRYDKNMEWPVTIRINDPDESGQPRWGTYEYTNRYDQNGNIIERVDKNSNVTFFYDSEGNVIKEDHVYYEMNYIYKDGHLTEAVCYENDELIWRYEYRIECRYDENNYLVEEIEYKNGVISGRTAYQYYTNGVLSKKSSYSGDELNKEHISEFDVNGNLIAESIVNPECPEITHSSKYGYTSSGMLNREQHYYADGSLANEIVYEYDIAGNLIAQSFRDDEGEYQCNTFRYDTDGYLTGLEMVYDGQQVVVADIQFDLVSVSEETSAELEMVFDAWKEELGGFDFEWNI